MEAEGDGVSEKRVMEELGFYLKGASGLFKEWSYIIKHTLKKNHHGCMGEKVNQRRTRPEDRLPGRKLWPHPR